MVFLEFIYQNAVRKNKSDMKKINDFFSRIYNTFVSLETNIFEIKCLLLIMLSND